MGEIDDVFPVLKLIVDGDIEKGVPLSTLRFPEPVTRKSTHVSGQL